MQINPVLTEARLPLCTSSNRAWRPHALRLELSCVSTWWIISHRSHCVVLLAEWCCFKLRPVPCWLRPGCDVVLACVVLFQAQCGAVGVIVLSSCGLLSQAAVCVLVYVTGQFVRTVTVSRYGTSAFPQPFTFDLSFVAPEFETESVCLHVWLTCSVCKSCLSGFASCCLLRVGKYTPTHWLVCLA